MGAKAGQSFERAMGELLRRLGFVTVAERTDVRCHKPELHTRSPHGIDRVVRFEPSRILLRPLMAPETEKNIAVSCKLGTAGRTDVGG